MPRNNIKHMDTGSPEWRAWRKMRDRCHNSNMKCWKNYGGRGIGIVPEWNDYSQFLADMGRKPNPKLSLERLRVNEEYGPTNCIWADWTTQQRNKRSVKLSMKKALAIRARRDKGETYASLGRDYGCTPENIMRVVKEETWI
jgi:hypothetical protein